MKLRFDQDSILYWADRYSIPREEEDLIDLHIPIQNRGYLLKSDLRALAKWKSPRSAGHVEKNSDSYIREITHFSLATSDERARVESLTLLSGVSWPTASVVLHLFHQQKYPILDFRALWSMDEKVPTQYGFEFWQEYVDATRAVAQQNDISMRILDRALWQYSKEHQPPNGA
jgi:hypothetical protein